MESKEVVEKVQEKIDLFQKTFRCPICLELFLNPITTRCNHIFCRHCILETINTQPKAPCPLCKETFTKRSLQLLPRWNDIVNKIRELISAFQNDTGVLFSPEPAPLTPAINNDKVDNNQSAAPSRAINRSEKNRQATKKKVKTRNSGAQEQILTQEIYEDDDLPILHQTPLKSHINIRCGFPVNKNAKEKKSSKGGQLSPSLKDMLSEITEVEDKDDQDLQKKNDTCKKHKQNRGRRSARKGVGTMRARNRVTGKGNRSQSNQSDKISEDVQNICNIKATSEIKQSDRQIKESKEYHPESGVMLLEENQADKKVDTTFVGPVDKSEQCEGLEVSLRKLKETGDSNLEMCQNVDKNCIKWQQDCKQNQSVKVNQWLNEMPESGTVANLTELNMPMDVEKNTENNLLKELEGKNSTPKNPAIKEASNMTQAGDMFKDDQHSCATSGSATAINKVVTKHRIFKSRNLAATSPQRLRKTNQPDLYLFKASQKTPEGKGQKGKGHGHRRKNKKKLESTVISSAREKKNDEQSKRNEFIKVDADKLRKSGDQSISEMHEAVIHNDTVDPQGAFAETADGAGGSRLVNEVTQPSEDLSVAEKNSSCGEELGIELYVDTYPGPKAKRPRRRQSVKQSSKERKKQQKDNSADVSELEDLVKKIAEAEQCELMLSQQLREIEKKERSKNEDCQKGLQEQIKATNCKVDSLQSNTRLEVKSSKEAELSDGTKQEHEKSEQVLVSTGTQQKQDTSFSQVDRVQVTNTGDRKIKRTRRKLARRPNVKTRRSQRQKKKQPPHLMSSPMSTEDLQPDIPVDNRKPDEPLVIEVIAEINHSPVDDSSCVPGTRCIDPECDPEGKAKEKIKEKTQTDSDSPDTTDVNTVSATSEDPGKNKNLSEYNILDTNDANNQLEDVRKPSDETADESHLDEKIKNPPQELAGSGIANENVTEMTLPAESLSHYETRTERSSQLEDFNHSAESINCHLDYPSGSGDGCVPVVETTQHKLQAEDVSEISIKVADNLQDIDSVTDDIKLDNNLPGDKEMMNDNAEDYGDGDGKSDDNIRQHEDAALTVTGCERFSKRKSFSLDFVSTLKSKSPAEEFESLDLAVMEAAELIYNNKKEFSGSTVDMASAVTSGSEVLSVTQAASDTHSAVLPFLNKVLEKSAVDSSTAVSVSDIGQDTDSVAKASVFSEQSENSVSLLKSDKPTTVCDDKDDPSIHKISSQHGSMSPSSEPNQNELDAGVDAAAQDTSSCSSSSDEMLITNRYQINEALQEDSHDNDAIVDMTTAATISRQYDDKCQRLQESSGHDKVDESCLQDANTDKDGGGDDDDDEDDDCVPPTPFKDVKKISPKSPFQKFYKDKKADIQDSDSNSDEDHIIMKRRKGCNLLKDDSSSSDDEVMCIQLDERSSPKNISLTSAGVFCSLSELPTTQYKEHLKIDMENIQNEIARLEAKLHEENTMTENYNAEFANSQSDSGDDNDDFVIRRRKRNKNQVMAIEDSNEDLDDACTVSCEKGLPKTQTSDVVEESSDVDMFRATEQIDSPTARLNSVEIIVGETQPLSENDSPSLPSPPPALLSTNPQECEADEDKMKRGSHGMELRRTDQGRLEKNLMTGSDPVSCDVAVHEEDKSETSVTEIQSPSSSSSSFSRKRKRNKQVDFVVDGSKRTKVVDGQEMYVDSDCPENISPTNKDESSMHAVISERRLHDVVTNQMVTKNDVTEEMVCQKRDNEEKSIISPVINNDPAVCDYQKCGIPADCHQMRTPLQSRKIQQTLLSKLSAVQTSPYDVSKNFDFPHRPEWCFSVSGINKATDMPFVNQFISLLGASFSKRVTADTTHVLMKPASLGSRRCQRTLKYFQALAHHKWIVSVDWVISSVKRKRMLPIEMYEIVGDTVEEDEHFAPQRARISRSLLLDRHQIYCFGQFRDLSRDDLNDLIEACGGDVISYTSQFATEDDFIKIVIIDSEMTAVAPMLSKLEKAYGCCILTKDWLLDSIGTYSLKDMNLYAVEIS